MWINQNFTKRAEVYCAHGSTGFFLLQVCQNAVTACVLKLYLFRSFVPGTHTIKYFFENSNKIFWVRELQLFGRWRGNNCSVAGGATNNIKYCLLPLQRPNSCNSRTQNKFFILGLKWYFINYGFKDPRSVSLYPYYRSNILQYVTFTKKVTLQKQLLNLWQIMCFWTKKWNTQQQQNKKSNLKPLLEPGIEPGTSRTTESTESNDCSQAISLFRRNGSKRI